MKVFKAVNIVCCLYIWLANASSFQRPWTNADDEGFSEDEINNVILI